MNYCTVEDQTIVTYKRFHESETDVYPSITLCWTMAIDEEKLKRFDNEFTLKAYTHFLYGHSIGEHWNKDMLRVNYDNVTINFDDYLLRYGYSNASMRLFDKVMDIYSKAKGMKCKPGYKEESAFSQKCFTIDIPFEKGNEISQFHVSLETGIFGKTGGLIDPFADLIDENKFVVHLHYPNQSIGRAFLGKLKWYLREPGLITNYVVTVGDIDIRVRRNTNNEPCIEGLPNYDLQVVEAVLNTVGCKPPYLSSWPSLEPCSKQEQLERFADMLLEASLSGNKRPSYMTKTPCRSLERIHYDVHTTETHADWNDTTVNVILDFAEYTYKEVKNIRGMDAQALIGKNTISNYFSAKKLQTEIKINYIKHIFDFVGNAGGYLGLFLGYALLNVPEIVQGAYNWLRTDWS